MFSVKFKQLLLGCGLALIGSTAYALPALQLGTTTDLTTDWSYNAGTQTWDYVGGIGSTANFSAFANADPGNGAYAWDAAGAGTQTAYLVVAAAPETTGTFDVSVAGGTFHDSGIGSPPLEDPNSLAPHGIYDTYFEIYKFVFDGPVTTISDTQPGETGTGNGYIEDFGVSINSLSAGISALHFDLFTVSDDGIYSPGEASDNGFVNAFAPFSHDAEWTPGPDPDPDPDPSIPVPSTVLLLGIGLMGLRFMRGKVG